ncbi:MAG: amidohydrolase family protein [Armatimonadetes bacterium]|nr:amidohydrolase family protein [Armatimonadota bacterium]
MARFGPCLERPPLILRPAAVALPHGLQAGLEVEVADGVIAAIRPFTGSAEPYILSGSFVNAHSHLEYYGFKDKISSSEYWPWIRELTALKLTQEPAQITSDCLEAARANWQTGVRFIAEHSDRHGAAEAMAHVGLDGVIFQEVITILESQAPVEKLARIRAKLAETRRIFPNAVLAPHATYTVDPETLRSLATESPLSIHVAETTYEREFFADASGPIQEFYDRFSLPHPGRHRSAVAFLASLGMLKPGTQIVHACDVDAEDMALLASAGCSVAHCPRSNIRLGCPDAPVREMLDAGIAVGLGLDSAASSGEIDMFDEMRAALTVSRKRGKPISAEEVWRMATGISSGLASYEIKEAARTPLLKIDLPSKLTFEALIEESTPQSVHPLT